MPQCYAIGCSRMTGKGCTRDRCPIKPSPIIAVSEGLQPLANEIDRRIAELAGERVCFSLFVWTEGRAQYVSNTTDRPAIKKAIREVTDSWDAGMPDIPAHKID